jgi:hypothetical protein
MNERKTVIKLNLLFRYVVTIFLDDGSSFKNYASNKAELEEFKKAFYECKKELPYVSHAVVTYWITGIVADTWL